MAHNSLPLSYEKLRTEKKYINLPKLAEGEHRFRIVQRAIGGWIDWFEKKPCRFRPEDKPKSPFDPAKPVKAFWALYVWDYAQEDLFVMEITQNSVRSSLEGLAHSEDWGDLTSFDIKIKKEGALKETKYTVIPVPPKPMSDVIKRAMLDSPVRLEALYEGKDPWTDLIEDSFHGDMPPEHGALTPEQEARLDALLCQIEDDVYLDKLENRLQVHSVYAIDPKHYDRVIRELESKVKSLKGVSNEPARVA